MKNYKRILAGVLAGTMIMGSSLVVLADEDRTTGTGELEGTVSTDVFAVVLPTLAEPDTTFDFILDPEGLIAATNAARYNGATFGTGTLFFANVDTDGNVTGYSNTSDTLTVTNKSSIPVDVSLSASVANATGITLTDDDTFADNTSASVYLAITDGTDTFAITDDGATVSKQINAAPDGSYEVQWDSTNEEYVYVLVDPDSTAFEEYSFQLTGASNSAGDWSGLAEVTPSVEVVWNVVAHSDIPTIFTKTYTMVSGSPVNISVSLGEGDTAATGISSITYKNSSGANTSLASSNYTFANGTLTISASYISSLVSSNVSSRDYTIIFNDSASTQVTITLKQ